MGFNLKKILRALLFSTSDPLTIKDIQAVITRYHSELENAKKALAKNAEQNDSMIQMPPEPQLDEPRGENQAEQTEIEDIMSQVPTLLTATQIREAMEEIAGELEENGDVCRLLQSSSGFKLAISKDYADWVRLLRNDPRPQKLTRAALETLAIIAYRQPVTRAEIEAIRGVNADSAITRLTEKELIFISGRADLPGRPVQFSTTSNFLDFIGVNSIEELPASDVLSPNQISEWIRRASSPQEIKEKDVGLPDNDAEHNTREVVIDSENSVQEELNISNGVEEDSIDTQQNVDEPIATADDSQEEL
ncbi:MAG: SMC-Scp complex subunit ScpB [Opitutales bacterium]|nr:SMC-Scp complex subunit ScpB [Opitutales bacterium]